MTPPAPFRLLMTTDAVGGVWTFATTLARGLAERGIEVLLVSQGPAPDAEQQAEVAGIPGLRLEVTDLALEWMDKDGRDRPRAREVLREIETAWRPDLVHLNSYREAGIGWAAPVLVTAHSCVGSWWRACRGDPVAAEWARYMSAVVEGMAAAKIVTAPTRAMLESFTRLYGYDGPTAVIPNGIELALPARERRPFIAAAGRLWDEAKNMGVLNDVAPDIPWPIHALGPVRGPNGAAAGFRNLVLRGNLPRADFLATLAEAEVFAAPALYEPFGLAVLEAARCGAALVLSDIPTFRELWEGAALFVPARERGAWRDALLRVAGNPLLRRELQQQAQGRARRYGSEQMIRTYAAHYAALSLRPLAAAKTMEGTQS
ncbi:MAG TPA: glycosyltransferase family 4 protein [Sphingomonadales bacterium]